MTPASGEIRGPGGWSRRTASSFDPLHHASRGMRSQLKKIEPLKSLARIIDLNFEQLEGIRTALRDVADGAGAWNASVLATLAETTKAVREAAVANAEASKALRDEAGGAAAEARAAVDHSSEAL